MIPISKPIITKNDINAVVDVLRSGELVQGKVVQKLEQEFVALCGATYAIAINNGTSALHTALYSLGIKSGDEVITTPFTFIASVNAILMVGAIPVFVDVQNDTFNIHPKNIEKAITKKTKAILAVNLFGQPCDYDEINKIAKQYGLFVIEDAAQSIDAHYKNKKSGNVADISCFSFYATKNILSGEGGMITTNSQKYAEKAMLFRQHGEEKNKKYSYHGLGYNYRMTDIHAALALSQLQRIDKLTRKRQALAKEYAKKLIVPGIVLPVIKKDRSSVFHQYTVRITTDCKLDRSGLQEYLKKHGILTGIYYPVPLHRVDHLKEYVKKDTNLSIAERLSQEVLSLPIHPKVRKKDIQLITNYIREL